MRIYDQKICFINCHFAAHLEAVNRRNADFDHVFQTMTFSRISSGLNAAIGLYIFSSYGLDSITFFMEQHLELLASG